MPSSTFFRILFFQYLLYIVYFAANTFPYLFKRTINSSVKFPSISNLHQFIFKFYLQKPLSAVTPHLGPCNGQAISECNHWSFLICEMHLRHDQESEVHSGVVQISPPSLFFSSNNTNTFYKDCKVSAKKSVYRSATSESDIIHATTFLIANTPRQSYHHGR